MPVYVITYDLNKPGQDYNALYEEIKSLGYWWHYLDSTWLVDTQNTSAYNIANRLKQHIDDNDRLLVIQVIKNYGGWLPQDAWDWIKQHIG